MTNPFVAPAAPGGGEAAPRPRDLVGCLVAYSPKVYTPAGAPGNTQGVDGGEPRDRVTTDLYILETPRGPIQYGGSPEWEAKPTPHTHTIVAPARYSSIWVSNQTIVSALAPSGQPLVGQMVLGRIERSDVGRRPFNLVAVEGTPDEEKAIMIWSRIQMGAMPYNQAVPLNGVVAAPNSVQYAQPPMVPQATQLPPAAPLPVDPQAQFAAWMAAQQAPQIPPAPPGWDATMWAGLTDVQRNQVLASLAPPQQQPSAPPW